VDLKVIFCLLYGVSSVAVRIPYAVAIQFPLAPII
jgi:hypothetical protein